MLKCIDLSTASEGQLSFCKLVALKPHLALEGFAYLILIIRLLSLIFILITFCVDVAKVDLF